MSPRRRWTATGSQLLHDLAKAHNKAIVVVTHDLRLKAYADRTYAIMDGKMTVA